MKFSVSVPDDLWTAVHPPDSGPSDTVQRGLRALLEQQRNEARPMANAPRQDALARYSSSFEESVTKAADSVTAALDNGYRFGLLIASGMDGIDFDVLEDPKANESLRSLLLTWGDQDSQEIFSFEFSATVHSMLLRTFIEEPDESVASTVMEILGEQDPGGVDTPGVMWIHGPIDTMVAPAGFVVPRVSATFADGMLAALRDVRDEALRRVRGVEQ